MKKKVLLTLAAAMAVTSVSFASPLSNYDKGSLAIDLNMSISPKLESGDSIDAKSRLGAGITYGIGDKFAVQYNYLDNKSKNAPFEEYDGADYEIGTQNAQVTGQHFNLLYQINPNISAFAGWTKAKLKVNSTFEYGDGSGPLGNGSDSYKESQNGYQVGFIGQTKLADNLTGWTLISAGNKINAYEIGVGYDLAKNTEFNVFYRQTKYKDFGDSDDKFDVKTKGLGAGLTFKF